ncbi:sensor histidine kinase [Paenibacillus puerhi]|uniref:sensor histidine kinase n=1 Tax=Paenibacillus puerhi TaxID=2692622 RepID=UPI00135C694A|nr:HAMP domain-containing sensor histidine kinase [Paenibacillus puerhi]
MRREGNVPLLLLLQLMALAILAGMEILHKPPGIFGTGLWVLLFGVTGLLLAARLRWVRELENIVTHLQRVGQGNMNTRILVRNGHRAYLETVFAINALIEQLAAVQEQSVRSEAARKRLLSAISHDIRTPLTSMIGYMDALKDEVAASAEERRAYLDIISRKAASLKDLIEDMFELAKLDADDIVLRPEPLDLAEAAREAVIAWLPELQAKGIELKANLPDKPCRVEADSLVLQRILANLIKNAVQYGHDGHVLGIELGRREQDGDYELVVWDKGHGIPAQELPHIFERTYRASGSGGSLNGGSGLGLAIAKALVDKQGGRIWAQSEPEVRTAFGFTLPAADANRRKLRKM